MERSAEFNEGTMRARAPEFQSVQQQSNRNFKALSVLDNIMPNQNGLGGADLQRRIQGQRNSVGLSAATQERQVWLNQEPHRTVQDRY